MIVVMSMVVRVLLEEQCRNQIDGKSDHGHDDGFIKADITRIEEAVGRLGCR